MELVPAALETRCLILLPAAPGLAPAVLDYYLRNAAFLAPFEPERPAGFYTAEHHARELAADVQRAAQGTVRPVSSRISRVTACTKDSPFSTWPPGSV